MSLQLTTMIDGISEVADQYRVILDVWGVLHDGQVAFPDAISALKRCGPTGLIFGSCRTLPVVYVRLLKR